MSMSDDMPKSGAERMREFRARQKARQRAAVLAMPEDIYGKSRAHNPHQARGQGGKFTKSSPDPETLETVERSLGAPLLPFSEPTPPPEPKPKKPDPGTPITDQNGVVVGYLPPPDRPCEEKDIAWRQESWTVYYQGGFGRADGHLIHCHGCGWRSKPSLYGKWLNDEAARHLGLLAPR